MFLKRLGKPLSLCPFTRIDKVESRLQPLRHYKANRVGRSNCLLVHILVIHDAEFRSMAPPN